MRCVICHRRSDAWVCPYCADDVIDQERDDAGVHDYDTPALDTLEVRRHVQAYETSAIETRRLLQPHDSDAPGALRGQGVTEGRCSQHAAE